MGAAAWLTVIAGVAAGSYFFRAAPFVLGARYKIPPLLVEWLVLMSLGITAGLVAKAFFVRGGTVDFSNLPAQAAALATAWGVNRRSGNMLAALAAGVAAAAAVHYFAVWGTIT